MLHEPPLPTVPQLPTFEFGGAPIEHDGGSQYIVNCTAAPIPGQVWQVPE